MPFFSGFGLGLSLIIAIGAQNAFVLRQGLACQHRLAVCLCCALSDALLIGFGVAGFGSAVQWYPWLVELMRYTGAVFLLAYAARAAYSSLRGGGALSPANQGTRALGRTLVVCLALTWLNPHVYIDTVVLLGSIAATYGQSKALFGAGAVSASFAFFFALGYGAQLLRPLFAKPGAWRVLDGLVALLMTIIGVGLLTGA